MSKHPELTMATLIQIAAAQAAEIALLKGGGENEAKSAYLDVYRRFNRSEDAYLLKKTQDEGTQHLDKILSDFRRTSAPPAEHSPQES